MLALASVGLMPGLPRLVLGSAVMFFGFLMFVLPLAIQVRSASGTPRWGARIAATAISSLPILMGAILILMGSGAGLYRVAAGIVIFLIVGVFTAWVLLIEILR